MIIKERRYSISHYLLGALPARLGDEMSGPTMLLLGFAGGSVALGSTLLASATFAAAAGGPLLGAFLDRSRQPGKVLAATIAIYAIGVAIIAATLGHAPVFISVALAVCTGLFMPAIAGGWSSRLASFTAPEQMARASAIDATTFNIAGLAGPALAGLIAAWAGASWAVLLLVTLLVFALPMAWMLPKRRSVDTAALSFAQTIHAGFKAIFTQKLLLRITIISVISYLGIGMLWVVAPLVGQELFGHVGYGGVLLSALSASALVATLAYAKWPTRYSPDTVAFGTTIVLGLAMLVLAYATSGWLAILAMLIVGLADGPQLAAIFAVRHREAPDHVRSQVFTTGASLKISAAALGAGLAGHLASYSLFWTIMAAAAVQFAAALTFVVLSREHRST